MGAGSPIGVVDRWLAAALQTRLARVAVRLELWDGSTDYSGDRPPIGDLIARDRGTVLGLLLHPDLYFGECYMASRLFVRGHLARVLEALSRLTPHSPRWHDHVAARLSRRNSIRASRRNVHHHYDLGNDFYQSWLDDQLVYTCAYFETPNETLDQAQRAKLDLVCRKVRLQPGETVIEAGCGWGALALHMAGSYGVKVKAFNLSHEQITFARERAAREDLAGRVEFIEDDYRNVSGECDAFVSVGMLEHVGYKAYDDLADVLMRVLRRTGGRGLLHFIGRDIARPLNAWTRRRIFPGAYVPTLAEVTTRIMSPARMSVLDVENLRLHYARTLAHWGERFAGIEQQVRGRYGEEFRRAWELYLAGSEAAFSSGHLQLFQVVFAPAETEPPVLEARRRVPGRVTRAVVRCDALIVGGGPAGSTCARLLQRAGWNVLVIDRARFPRDKVCAGWVTPGVFDLLELNPDDYRATGLTIQTITGFRTSVFGAAARPIETRYSHPISYAIRRCEFDDFLLTRSKARVMEATPLASLERRGDRWIANGDIETPVVIGAGGHFCPVARHLRGVHDVVEPVVAKEAEFEVEDGDSNVSGEMPELFFSHDLEGYAWCVRKGRHLNIGIGRRDKGDFNDHVEDFIGFLERTSRAKRASIVRWHGHAYLASGTGPRRLIADGLVCAGDAAGLAYPESGEGIRPAVESGRLAAETLVAAGGRASRDALAPYESALRRRRYPAAAKTPERIEGLVKALGRRLMRSRAFTRHVVIDRWFLRA